jgi:hypothetical protein
MSSHTRFQHSVSTEKTQDNLLFLMSIYLNNKILLVYYMKTFQK